MRALTAGLMMAIVSAGGCGPGAVNAGGQSVTAPPESQVTVAREEPPEEEAPPDDAAPGLYVGVLPQLPRSAVEAHGAPGHFVIEGMRVVVDDSGTRVAPQVVTPPIQHAARSGSAWLFIDEGGAVLRSETFLGDLSVVDRLAAFTSVQRWPAGLAYVSDDMRIRLADGSAFRTVATPNDEAVVFAAVRHDGRGYARTLEGAYLGTSDGGRTWRRRNVEPDLDPGSPYTPFVLSENLQRADPWLAELVAWRQPGWWSMIRAIAVRAPPRPAPSDGYPLTEAGWSTAPYMVAARAGLAALLRRYPILLDRSAFGTAIPMEGNRWALMYGASRGQSLFGRGRSLPVLGTRGTFRPLAIPDGCARPALVGWGLVSECRVANHGSHQVVDVDGPWQPTMPVRPYEAPIAVSMGGRSAIFRGPRDTSSARRLSHLVYAERDGAEQHTGGVDLTWELFPQLTPDHVIGVDRATETVAWLDARTGDVVARRTPSAEMRRMRPHRRYIVPDGSVMDCFWNRLHRGGCAAVSPIRPTRSFLLPEGARQLAFLDPDFGIATGGSNLWATTNGGEDWLPLEIPDNASRSPHIHCHGESCFRGDVAITRDASALPPLRWSSPHAPEHERRGPVPMVCAAGSDAIAAGPTAWGALVHVRVEHTRRGEHEVTWWLPDGHTASASGRLRPPARGTQSQAGMDPGATVYDDRQPRRLVVVGASTRLLLMLACWTDGRSGCGLYAFREGAAPTYIPGLTPELAVPMPDGGIALLAKVGSQQAHHLIVIAPDGTSSVVAGALHAEGLAMVGGQPAMAEHRLRPPRGSLATGVHRVVLLSSRGRRSVELDLRSALDRPCAGGTQPEVRLYLTTDLLGRWNEALVSAGVPEAGDAGGVSEVWLSEGGDACLARVGRRVPNAARGLGRLTATAGTMRGTAVTESGAISIECRAP